MWFCVAANAQNLGVTFNLLRILEPYNKNNSQIFGHLRLHKTTYRDPPDPFFPYPNTKERKGSGHETMTGVDTSRYGIFVFS